MYSDILPPLGWNKGRIEIKYPTISVKDLTNPVFNISTSTGVNDYIAEQIIKTQDEMMGKIFISGDYIQPYAIVKLNNEKETKKMKAKKCDRCGKLYENPVNGENCGAEVRFRFLHVDDEENLSEKKIIEKQTKNIYINSLSVDVDICPDCRESFKRWFENGAGEG